MVERFVAFAGTISVANGASTVVGTGTVFSGRDRAGAQVWAQPAVGVPIRVGTVAEATERGVYDNLSLPLVSAYNGTTLTNVAYELIDGPAINNSATQAAIYSRFAAFFEQSMGVSGNLADDIDYSLVPNNTFFADSVTHTLWQWRNGALEQININAGFNPRGEYDAGTTYAENDLVSYSGGVFVCISDATVGHDPVISPSPTSDTYWTVLAMPLVGELFALAPFISGKPLSSEVVYRAVMASTILFPAGMSSSKASAGTAATASTVFSLKKNGGAAFGTVTFAISGTVGTYAAATDTTFTAGDVLTITAPSGQDATLADIAFMLRGLRDGGAEFNAIPLSGGTLTGALTYKARVDVASATTTNIGAATGNLIRVTGTTTIVQFDTVASGVYRHVTFAGALILTYDGTKLILPGGANITTAANDTALFESLGSGNWLCHYFKKQTGKPVIGPASTDITDSTAAGRGLLTGILGTPLYAVLDANATGTDTSSAQQWFPTSGKLAVAASTLYYFRGLLRLSRAAGVTSHTTTLSFGGTATITNADWAAWANVGDTITLGAWQGALWATDLTTGLLMKIASTSTTEQSFFMVEGHVRINAAGTFIPQFKYSAAPGGAPTILRDSFILLLPLGANTATRSGTWT